ncbi:MAG: integration host factor subunit beta [Magnetococcales bacterium]|nr:integration host factor subunit beta [Magnetococcales bacterium]
MTKSELIKKLADQTGMQNEVAAIMVDTVLEEITASLERGQRVELRGFGSFGLKDRKAREGRNPKTGEAVTIPAKRVSFFKAGKELKDRVDS